VVSPREMQGTASVAEDLAESFFLRSIQMDDDNACVSRRPLLRPIASSLFFLIFVLQMPMFHIHPACAKQTRRGPAVPPASGSREPSKVEYREAKRIEIPKALGMTGNWHAIAYEANVEDLTETDLPAKLCFFSDDRSEPEHCFQAVAARKDGTWNCQFVQELSVVPIFDKQHSQQGVLFVPMFSGGGSGTLSLITLWVFNEQKKRFENILPLITITNLGEYKILHGKGDQLDGTLVVADFVWEEGESHFEPHKYDITIYRYNQGDDLFERVGDYVTDKKYEGLDDADNIDVIRHEMKNIEKMIGSKP
jgi:hypothetical protein